MSSYASETLLTTSSAESVSYSWAFRSARVIWSWLRSSTKQISVPLPSFPAVLVRGQEVKVKPGLIWIQPDVGCECGQALIGPGVP